MSSSSEDDVVIPVKMVKRRHQHRVTSLDADKQKVNLYSHKILPKLGALSKIPLRITEDEGNDCVPFAAGLKTSPAKSLRNLHGHGVNSPSSDSNPVFPPTPPPPFNPTKIGRRSQKARKLLKEVSTVLSQVAEVHSSSQESPNLIEDPVKVIKETVVKVRLRGKLYKFRLEDHDSFDGVFQSLSRKVKVDTCRLLITFGDHRIYPSDTPAGIRLSIADILQCTVSQQRLVPDADNTIRIQMQGPFSKRKVVFSMGRSESFQAVMKEYAESSKANLEELQFRFDGDNLDPHATPTLLDMENGDCIDVMSSSVT